MSLANMLRTATLAVAGLVSTTSALATFFPGPSYAVGIPSGSNISSSSTGSLYFQISAPTTYQWVGLGIGTQMAGATIFVMYADGNGNVTVGVRDGRGHVQPQLDTAEQTGLTLLAGSGISNGMMVANVKCTSCELDSAATSTSSPWICAWNIDTAIDSISASASINQHDPANTRQFTFDLTSAAISSDTNPFLSSAATTSSGTSPPVSTPTTALAAGSGSGSGSASVIGPSFNTMKDYQIAHGVIMGVTVVLVFPLAAIFMRLGGSVWVHGIVQILGIVFLIIGLGLGVQLAKLTDLLFKSAGSTHTIFGTAIVALFLIQPFLGLWHHLQYRRTGARAPVSFAHIWYGRILMLLAIVNGGLGLQLAKNTKKKGEVAYIVLAAVVGAAYIAVVVLKRKGGAGGMGLRRGGRGEGKGVVGKGRGGEEDGSPVGMVERK